MGVNHVAIRLYDATTTQCYIGSNSSHHHQGPVTALKWSPDGRLYVSSSVDGSIKIWDGVSSHCVSTYTKAHDGHEVCSVQFTRNGRVMDFFLSPTNTNQFGFKIRRKVRPLIWKRLLDKVVGIVHQQMFDRLYWSWKPAIDIVCANKDALACAIARSTFSLKFS